VALSIRPAARVRCATILARGRGRERRAAARTRAIRPIRCAPRRSSRWCVAAVSGLHGL